MGDISTEPSMEEILSSIKRIIAEEGDAAVASRARRAPPPGRPVPASLRTVPDPAGNDDEVLELSDPVADAAAAVTPAPMPIGAPDTPRQPVAAQPMQQPEQILSPVTAEATRGRLEALSRMVVKPEAAAPAAADNTLEGMVRELLRPMLREWLDANLPRLVDEMVAREIARITGR
ncbi:DUF2497 domain-containing protein [Sphingomonas canadensis]|uniref:DUF2497 domain-containing protein n=1 Tax=Sphingomonas canadensis TaxID=1219257 RepID=A0ABW3HF85_9SPHN|nr:DUF2497 domain-containing protein [Sphingomonas canadensis]MCW3838016.1 DUF2497 domain-containing protein [Sphingomonas canadensis]